MGNCMYGQRRNRNGQNVRDYIDKNIRVQRTISAEVSVGKCPQKIGLDTNLQGKITSVREEKYVNNIPSVLDLVEDTQTRNKKKKNIYVCVDIIFYK